MCKYSYNYRVVPWKNFFVKNTSSGEDYNYLINLVDEKIVLADKYNKAADYVRNEYMTQSLKLSLPKKL